MPTDFLTAFTEIPGLLLQLCRMTGKSVQTLRLRAKIARRFPGAVLEPQVVVKGKLENLMLHGSVQLQSGTVLHLGGMEWCRNAGWLEIGDGATISPNCVLYAAGPGGIRIGRNFDCGPGVGIFSSRTDYRRGPGEHLFAPVVIGDDVTVFANVVLSPGAIVGNGAVIAANSVVNSKIPPCSLAGGCPARVLRSWSPQSPAKGPQDGPRG